MLAVGLLREYWNVPPDSPSQEKPEEDAEDEQLPPVFQEKVACRPISTTYQRIVSKTVWPGYEFLTVKDLLFEPYFDVACSCGPA